MSNLRCRVDHLFGCNVVVVGAVARSDDTEDQMDGIQSPLSAIECVADPRVSDNEVMTLDDEAAVAEYLRVLGDRLQMEYGNQLDALMDELDWTMARETLLADVRRIMASLISPISDVWTRVSITLYIRGGPK